MAWAGNLEDLPLPDLIRFYCGRRQTVRLTLSYPDGEAQLYFKDGALWDAVFGRLRGAEAVAAALARPAGEFSAELDVEPAARTIDEGWTLASAENARVRPLRAVPAARSGPSLSLSSQPASPSRTAWILVASAVALIAVGVAAYLVLKSRRAPAPPPAAPAVEAPITLGMSAALTGPSKELGLQMKVGLETAFALANDAGGVNGRRLTLLAFDDGYEPARTKEAMKELVEGKKVFAIIGNVGTPTAEVAVPYALEKKELFFGAFTGAGLLRRDPPDRYVFNYRASYAEETAAVVRWFVDVKRVKPSEIAVFAQQDGFGDAGFAGVAKALRRYGRAPDEILRVGFKRNTLEIQDAVDTIVKNRKQVRAIVIVAPYRPAAKFIEKMRDAGIDALISNVSFVGSTALADELRQIGPRYSTGIIVTQVVPPADSAATSVIRYREALAKYAQGAKPDFVSLEGFIDGEIFIEGLKRAGAHPTTESTIDALETIRDLDLGIGTKISYGPSEHQGSHKVWGTVLNESAQYQSLDLE